MKALGEVVKLAAEYLQGKGILRGRRDAEDLLAHVLGLKRLDLYMEFDRPLCEEELATYRTLLVRKARGEPVEYILGNVDFYGCHLHVGADVLIPRPETEVLLDKICTLLEKEGQMPGTAWDLCTGSGCLGLGLKKRFPHLRVVLSDISERALKVAGENALRNQLEVSLIHGDLLLPFEGQKADLVVANPPYISKEEVSRLDRGVKDFEPHLALIGGETGFEFYERLAKELPAYLNPRARVFFEIGAGQGEKILTFFEKSCWVAKFFETDYSGLDRFFFLEFE